MRTFSAEFLLIDIGNTDTKFRLAEPDRLLGSTRRTPTACLAKDVLHTLRGWHYHHVAISSVVPAATGKLLPLLDGPVLQVNYRLEVGVNLRGYPGIRTLGADRIADMTAAWALYGPGPLIVADLGTAAVFNAIDARGVFLGGVIAPGLAALGGSLQSRTAQLPPVGRHGPVRALGRTTREALLAGSVYGYRGLVREVLAGLQSELGTRARVIATGGDARRLGADLTAQIDVVDPELTLQGLRIVATRNRAAKHR